MTISGLSRHQKRASKTGIKNGHQKRASKTGIKIGLRQVRGKLVRHVNAVLLSVKRECATKKELRARANAEKEPSASKSPHCMGRVLKGSTV